MSILLNSFYLFYNKVVLGVVLGQNDADKYAGMNPNKTKSMYRRQLATVIAEKLPFSDLPPIFFNVKITMETLYVYYW